MKRNRAIIKVTPAYYQSYPGYQSYPSYGTWLDFTGGKTGKTNRLVVQFHASNEATNTLTQTVQHIHSHTLTHIHTRTHTKTYTQIPKHTPEMGCGKFFHYSSLIINPFSTSKSLFTSSTLYHNHVFQHFDHPEVVGQVNLLVVRYDFSMQNITFGSWNT